MGALKLANPMPADDPKSVTIEVRSPVGALVRTFSDPDLAIAWARHPQTIAERGHLTVEEVSTYEVRRRLYRPRKAKLTAISNKGMG